MTEIIIAIQDKLKLVAELKYIDENWGQLDYYSPNPPAKFPCALISISSASFSNIGTDKKASPVNRQIADAVSINFDFADMKLSPSSQMASAEQKNNAWKIFDIMQAAHQQIHGWSPNPDLCGKLIRTSLKRIMRDDGIQHYQVTYTLTISNI